MPAVRHRSNRLPLHTARRATVRSVVTMMSSRSLRVGRHGTARTISSVKGSSSPAAALVRAPASLACEDGVVEAVEGACAGAVDEWCVAEQRDVVEAEVPDRGIDHAVGGEGHDGTDKRASQDIVPEKEVSGYCEDMRSESAYQLWYSSMVRAPPMRQAPRRGA
jgi:hypothetical protein